MFCPRCGARFIERDGILYCERGNMEVTANLAQGLLECYVTESRQPREIRFDFRVGGVWFCPGCSVKLEEADGHIRCAKCGRNLNEFVFALIEHHFHEQVSGME